MRAQSEQDFASLLDDLMNAEREMRPADAVNSPSLRFDLLAQIERLQSENPTLAGEGALDAYRDHAGEPGVTKAEAGPQEASLEPALEDLFYLDPQSIARELGIKPKNTPAELDQARRAFALRYHPDRVPEEMRERAKMRMQIANMLIDEAKRAKPARTSKR